MRQLASTYPTITKALRILLTFILVFWSTFSIEQIALAEEAPVTYNETPPDGLLRQVTIYEVDGTNYKQVASTASDKAGSSSIDTREGEKIYRAVAAWETADRTPINTEDGKPWLTDANSLVDWKLHGELASLKSEGSEGATFIRIKGAGTEDGTVQAECVLKDSVRTDKAGPSLEYANAQINIELSNQAPEPEKIRVSVQATWIGDPPESVDVTLQRDGSDVETVQLSAANNWYHEWTELEKGPEYRVVESTPEGYDEPTSTPTTDEAGNVSFVIENKKAEPVKDPFITSIEILQTGGESFAEPRILALENDQKSYDFWARVAIKDPGVEEPTIVVVSPEKGLGAAVAESGAQFVSGFVFTDEHLQWSIEGEGASIGEHTGALSVDNGTEFAVRCTTTQGEEGQQPPADAISVNVGGSGESTDPYVSDLQILKTDGTPFADGEALDLQGSSSSSEGEGEGSEGEQSEEGNPDEGGDQATSEGSEEGAASGPLAYQFQVQVSITDPKDESVTTYVRTPDGWQNEAGEAVEAPCIITWEISGNTTSSISESGLLTIEGTTGANVRCFTTDGKDKAVVEDNVAVNIIAPEPEPEPEPGEDPAVEITYNPAPKGSEATLTAQPKNIEGDYTLMWEESKDSGATWEPIDKTDELITVMTDDEHIGRQYRVRLDREGEEPLYSTAATIVEKTDEPDDGQPRAVIEYIPVPKGQEAKLVSYPANVAQISWYITWEESTDDGKTWRDIGVYEEQILSVMTDDEHIGRMYRVILDIIEPEQMTLTSDPVKIVEGPRRLTVEIDMKYTYQGEPITFTAVPRNLPENVSPENLTYVWEVSEDNKQSWSVLDSGYKPTYTINETGPEILGNYYRVRVRTPEGEEAVSSPHLMAAIDERPEDTPTPEPTPDPEHFEPVVPTDDPSPGDTEEPSPDAPVVPTPAVDEPTNPNDSNNNSNNAAPPQEYKPQPHEQKPETMSEMVDRYGEVEMAYDDGSTATMRPLDQIETEPMPMSEEEATTPGMRLRELYMQEEQPTLHDILQQNPFGQLIIPFCLAIVAAGALEKYLRFREQRRPSLAAF